MLVIKQQDIDLFQRSLNNITLKSVSYTHLPTRMEIQKFTTHSEIYVFILILKSYNFISKNCMIFFILSHKIPLPIIKYLFTFILVYGGEVLRGISLPIFIKFPFSQFLHLPILIPVNLKNSSADDKFSISLGLILNISLHRLSFKFLFLFAKIP